MASALPADVDKAQEDSIDFNDVFSLRKPKDAKAGAWGVLENCPVLKRGWTLDGSCRSPDAHCNATLIQTT